MWVHPDPPNNKTHINSALVEKALCVRVAGAPLFSEAEVGAWAPELLTNLFAALDANAENEYIMKVRLCFF